jgi:hypothetical protein
MDSNLDLGNCRAIPAQPHELPQPVAIKAAGPDGNCAGHCQKQGGDAMPEKRILDAEPISRRTGLRCHGNGKSHQLLA